MIVLYYQLCARVHLKSCLHWSVFLWLLYYYLCMFIIYSLVTLIRRDNLLKQMLYHSVAKSTAMDHRIRDLMFKVVLLFMQVVMASAAAYFMLLNDRANLFVRNSIVARRMET